MTAILRVGRYVRHALSAQVRPVRLRMNRVSQDMIDSGDGQFANPPNDPITLNGAPYQTRLRVFDERSGRLVREFWSEIDGTWQVAYLNRAKDYLVVCYNGAYPALAYDHQTPDPMS